MGGQRGWRFWRWLSTELLACIYGYFNKRAVDERCGGELIVIIYFLFFVEHECSPSEHHFSFVWLL